MRILGIDPGTATTGYAFIDVDTLGKPFLVESSVVLTPAEELMHNRLSMLYQGLNTLSKKYRPDVMVVERLFFNTNVKTAISVGQARGIALLVASEHKMNLFEYTALEAKKSIAGYGRASKKEIQNAVKEVMGLDAIIKPDDASDAVAMVLCHLHKASLKSV